MGSIITGDEAYCMICGAPGAVRHHAIGGIGKRNLADEDGLYVPLCPSCHNMSQGKRPPGWGCDVHHCAKLKSLMNALAQASWEREYVAKEGEGDARDAFRQRYGKSYL